MKGWQEEVAPVTRVRVSVVVPVFNPGPGFDELIQSFDRQTLGPEEFEVILCDDGSDESTRHRLQHVARARSHVRVLTLAHTGWPGTPRNHGIDAARGEYVFFADQDDWLFDAALQHLCDYADHHSSDVVVGKVVGVGRRIPEQIFRRDVPHAVLGQDPLLELLTPHKLFRSSFLRKHDIRFPDGRVRLEDHLFVMTAYFRAETISILASERCYAWVNNKGSASSSRIDPVTYFPHLEAVLDLVEANTEPGAFRDTLLRHWYRGKILKRLGGKRMVAYPDDYRARFLDVVVPLAQRRFGPAVEDRLAFPLRIRSALLRAGRRDELLRFAEFEAGLECRARVTSARWVGRKLTLSVDVRIVHGGEEALIFDPRESDAASAIDAQPSQPRPSILRLPESLGVDVLPEDALDARRDLRRDRVEFLLREAGDDSDVDTATRRIPGRASRNLTPVTVTIDPLQLFSRSDESVGGRLVAHVRRAGWTFDAALHADQATLDSVGPSPVLAGRRCELVATSDGTVELRRHWPAGRVRDLTARAVRRARWLARKHVPERIRKAFAGRTA
jgi:glycosyltransferase involved in cell wall biosynthesis